MVRKFYSLYLLIILLALVLCITFIFNRVLINRNVFYNTFQSQYDVIKIDEFYSSQRKYVFILYIFIPIWLIIKNFIVSICLQIGLLLSNKKLKFGSTLRIALTTEFVFLLPQLIKLIWFLLVKTDYTLTDVQQFYPLSALNLFKIENLSASLIYPFQTFNVFEILYWIILAGGIKQALDTDINHGIRVVFSGYIPALILWIICVMFITVSLSPAV